MHSHVKTSNEVETVFPTRSLMVSASNFLEMVIKSKKIRSVGISNSEFFLKQGPEIIKKVLANGAEFELLFLDPDGKYTRFREVKEYLDEGTVQAVTRSAISVAKKIRRQLKEEYEEDMKMQGEMLDKFKLFLYDEIPRMNMIFINDDTLFLQYYANSIEGVSNPCFFIKKCEESPIYDFCNKAYNGIKRKSKIIE